MFTGLKAEKSLASPFTTKLAWLWFLLAVILCMPSSVRANEQFTAAELDTLVSTIALYPDPLLVQVLAASVHGDEIPGAADWANQNKHLKGQELADRIKLEDLPYDESVQALIPFPTVLATMAKYQTWTDQLGDAVATQKEAVMDAVQRMRSAAYNHGHLQTNEQVKVIKEKAIIIEPVQKEYVYVPVYNPHIVYYVYSNGYPGLRYRTGVWVGSYYDYWGWGTSRFEWDTHLIYVHDYRWYHNRPLPPRHPRHHNPPPPPRHNHYVAPARHDSYTPPPSRPVKVPMNHNTAPRSKAEIHHSAAHPNTIATVKTTKDNYWQEDNSKNNNQGFGNIKTTRSSQKNYDDSRSSRNNNSRSNGNSNRNGNSRGGFGKSMRK